MRTSWLSASTSVKSNASLSKEPTSNTASPLALPDQHRRCSASDAPRVATGSSRNAGFRSLKNRRHQAAVSCRSMTRPSAWTVTCAPSECRWAIASGSRAARAASKRAAFAVAAFGRTRRPRSSTVREGAGADRACGAAVSSKDPEQEELPFVGAAADALCAGVRPAEEEPVRAQREDVVNAGGEVGGHLEQSAQRPQDLLGSTHRPPPDDAAAVDGLDGGGERGGIAIEIERFHHGS